MAEKLDARADLALSAKLAGVKTHTLGAQRSRGHVPATDYDLRDVMSLAVAERLAGKLRLEIAARIAWTLREDWTNFVMLAERGDRVWLVVKQTSRGLEFTVAQDVTLPQTLAAGGIVVDLTTIAADVLRRHAEHLKVTAKRGARAPSPGALLIEAPASVPLPVPAPVKEKVR